MKKVQRIVVAAGAVAALSVAATAAAATFADNADPVLPNHHTMDHIRHLDTGNGTAMSATDFKILHDMLPKEATTDDEGNRSLSQGDLPAAESGRSLLNMSADRSLAAVRLDRGPVCIVARLTSKSNLTGCFDEFRDDLGVAGAWTEDGHVKFGLASDDVTAIHVQTSTGGTERAALANNAFWWSSDDADRSDYATALVVSYEDGSTRTVDLPDEKEAASTHA